MRGQIWNSPFEPKYGVYAEIPIHLYQAHFWRTGQQQKTNRVVAVQYLSRLTAFQQRRTTVNVTSCRMDVDMTLFRRHVSSGIINVILSMQ